MQRMATALPIVLWLALSLAAQEERAVDNFAGVGVRAMGMGGAYVGVSDDFTAVYWNPAGLAKMKTREVYVAFLRNGTANDATFNGNPSSTDLSNTRFGSLGFVYPYPVYRGSLVFAAGFNRVKDFDWSLRESGIGLADSLSFDNSFSHEGELAITSVAAAVEVSPSVSLGLTLSLISGEDQSMSEFVTTDPENIAFEKRWRAREAFLDNYKTTYTVTLGAMARASKTRIGATVSTGPTHEISYDFSAPVLDETMKCTDSSPPPTVPWNSIECDDNDRVFQSPSETESSSYEISLPIELAAGAAYQPVPSLLLAGGITIAEWTQTEYRRRDRSDVRANTAFESQYTDATRYHLGLEWQVPWIALDVRAGYYIDPLPFVGPREPDLAVHPETNPRIIVKQDRSFLTLGAGLMLEEAVKIDLSWNHGTFTRQEHPLVQKVTVERVFAGLAYTF